MDRRFRIHHLSFIIRKSRGFTLIELMVVISISAILGTVGIAAYVNYNNAQVLQTSTNEVVTMLNLAKSRAQSQVKIGTNCEFKMTLEGYKVVITASGRNYEYALKSRCSEADSQPPLKTKSLPKDISFGSGDWGIAADFENTFFFPVQTGGVEATDSLGASLKPLTGPWEIVISNASLKQIITINSLGGISVSPPKSKWDRWRRDFL